MKHLRKFEKYTINRKREEIIKESVLQVNDIYKVRAFLDIPQSLINAYVKKVKDTTGKNLRQFYGDVDIAEEIVKYINTNFLNVDQIPGGALMGDAQAQGEGQGQTIPQGQGGTQGQAQIPQGQGQAQTMPQGQPQAQTQAQPQVQVQTDVQSQAQPVQAQPQAQPQAQGQAQGDFEEVGDEEDDENDD